MIAYVVSSCAPSWLSKNESTTLYFSICRMHRSLTEGYHWIQLYILSHTPAKIRITIATKFIELELRDLPLVRPKLLIVDTIGVASTKYVHHRISTTSAVIGMWHYGE